MSRVKKWLIYDGRYHLDPDRAIVHEVCDTEDEASINKLDYGSDCVVVPTELEI